MNILHVQASPSSAQHSRSQQVARAFLDEFLRLQPDSSVEEIDVWKAPLPEFDDKMIAAKFAVLRSQTATDEQRAVWAQALSLARRFNAADLHLFSVPMWNFALPYKLKHFIDVVTLPGENWFWTARDGYQSLLTGKHAVLVYSSAGAYAVDGATEGDFQKRYMRRWLSFLGIDDVYEINVAPTLAPPESVSSKVLEAKAQALTLAKTLSTLLRPIL
jgi:FMN-dependent NADH-azoreductase